MAQKITRIPTQADIIAAHECIQPYIHRTPVLRSRSIDQIAGASLFFKCENFQKVGAFKMRGASYAVQTLTDAEKAKGVATHSSGNHAQAVALSAKNEGIPAYIVMPENAPTAKRKATAGYGAEIITCAATLASRQTTLEQVVERTGATFIHPYNDYNVITGQATTAKELIEAVDKLDVLMAPIGGGGLMSGTALAAKYWLPSAAVIGSEPALVDDAYRSFHSGQLKTNERTDTIADGLRTNLGPKTFGIIREEVDAIYRVSEAEIVAAMRLIWERMKIIVEPSCAVPLAAVLKQPQFFAGKRIGIILTGGNVDLANLPFA